MKDFDITFIEVAVAMIVFGLTIWLGTKKDTSLIKRIVIVSTVIVLAILIIVAKIYGFESTIFGISNTIETEVSDNGETEEIDNGMIEETDKEDTEESGDGGTITDSNKKGFVLNGEYYSYDGKFQYPSDEHQNKVTLSFSQEDVKGWKVVITIPDGPFGIELVESYSDKIEFLISSGEYSLFVNNPNAEEGYHYSGLVNFDHDGDYTVELTRVKTKEDPELPPGDGFVLNGIYYSYDGKTIYPSDVHQNNVTLTFTQVDITGWEVTIGIPDGPSGTSLVKSYSDKIEFSVSSGEYAIQAFKIVDEKEYLYKSIVDIDSDGEYTVDLNKAEYIVLE